MGVYDNKAATVLLVGRLLESPKAQILLYYACCKVFGLTLTYPLASPIPLSFINVGGL